MATKQKSLPTKKASEDKTTSGILKTDARINVHGKVVFVNIPESDIVLTPNGEYGNRAVFVTSLYSLKKLVDGEWEGINLGRFKE
jgi:hypothetical protein